MYTKYVPKRKKYGSAGFAARLHMAAIDHNSNVGRDQAKTKGGKLRFKLQYSKGAGDYVVKPIKSPKVHDYRQQLLLGVITRCETGKFIIQSKLCNTYFM